MCERANVESDSGICHVTWSIVGFFLHDNGTDDEHDGENGNGDDYGDVNGGHNLVHDDISHNGENLTLAGGRPPSAWQIIVMFVFSNTWESNKEDIEKRVV